MCHFKSAIALKNGDIIHDDHTDSHEILIAAHGLKDDGRATRTWVRVEFVPTEGWEGVEDETKWTLKLDESNTPAWWEDVRERVRASLWAVVQRNIVKDERKCLLGGTWILLPGSRVRQIVGGRILLARDADLRSADLGGADLRSADLGGANLGGANLGGANRDINAPSGWRIENGILVKDNK